MINGIAMLEVIKGLRLHRDAALAHLSEAQHHYLDQRVEIGEWYPEADHIELLRAVAALFGPPGLDAWRWMGRQRAVLDLQEIFSDVLHEGDPASTLGAFKRLWPLYRNTGRLRVELSEDRTHRLYLIDYPYTRAEMVRLFTGYIEAGLELSGLSTFTVDEPASWTPDEAEWVVSWPAER